ncbi:MAG: toast rack family protein [Gemmatimonadota bacterium]|jgi:hypothetical protein
MRTSEVLRRGALVAALLAGPALLIGSPDALAGQSWRTVTMSRQRSDVDEMKVRVAYGAGRFSVRPIDGELLYRMQLRYDEESFEPVAELDGDRLELGVENIGKRFRLGRDRDDGRMDLELNRGVPMDLQLEFGAVRADVDLGGLSLNELELSTGASDSRVDVSRPNRLAMSRAELTVGAADFTARHLGNLNAEDITVSAGVGDVTLEFTGEWRRDARVKVDMGLGSLELRFPRGLGVKLEKDTFLTSLDSQGLVKRGDAYYSTDWDEAERRVVVEVDAAFGSIDISWVR